MDSFFKAKTKNGKQVKTKDQNLKDKYFVKGFKKMDILDVSMMKIKDFADKHEKKCI